jgi:glyoxylase-like metal-dependent hydrolase (beta-lactamase superfamily II)
LQGGDLDLLLQNIRENILTLSDTTIVYPGHGPETTVKDEKDYNPFLS